jgi:YD repeat-containing protein
MRQCPPRAAVPTIALLLGLVAAVSAQPPAIHYVYDELNRLGAVIDQQGNAATYTYDAVGNVLGIERFDATDLPGAVGITLVRPGVGRPGTRVEIFGKGFAASPAQNTVGFTGGAAGVSAAAANRLETTVPAGAATGPITITTPLGAATSSTVFRVLGVLTVTPATMSLGPTRTQQFDAQEAGTRTTSVRWAVNGLPGGDSATGTISADGLYTAPTTLPTPATVTVTATHRDDASVSASATVTLLPPQPVFLAAAGVSVALTPPRRVERNLGAAVSIRLRLPATTLTLAPGVSLRRDVAAALLVGPAVVVSREPVITAVSPAAAARGTTSAIVVTGAGFAGATTLTALLGLAIDAAIAVGPLAIDAHGTQATADLTISASAALGARILRITTPTAASTAVGTGGNAFTVQ